MNKVILIGRITRDITVKESANGKAFGSFSIAVKKAFKNGDNDSDFFVCKAFGATAELIGRHFTKGQRIGIEGSLSQESWIDKDGKKVERVVVNVSSIEFIEPKNFQNSFTPSEVDDDNVPF